MTMQIRGQNITLRGQDLTDARAKDTLAQQGLEVKETGDGNFIIIDKKNNGTPRRSSTRPASRCRASRTSPRAKARRSASASARSRRTTSSRNCRRRHDGQVRRGEAGAATCRSSAARWRRCEQGPVRRSSRSTSRRSATSSTPCCARNPAPRSPTEFENADKQYFPQPGDSDGVIKQKQEAREREIKALAMAGPGAKQFPEIKRPKEEGDAAATSFASEADAAAAAKAGKIKKAATRSPWAVSQGRGTSGLRRRQRGRRAANSSPTSAPPSDKEVTNENYRVPFTDTRIPHTSTLNQFLISTGRGMVDLWAGAKQIAGADVSEQPDDLEQFKKLEKEAPITSTVGRVAGQVAPTLAVPFGTAAKGVQMLSKLRSSRASLAPAPERTPW
jgi:hypothetical protein